MTWKGIVGKGLALPELQIYVDNLKFDRWRPSGMVLHNTAAPTLKQWHDVPGATRMRNLENYYKNERGWPSAPHAFVADDLVWLFTPMNTPGTHSPSFNGTHLGIEMVGDFSREDDDAGSGLKVKKNTAALFAMLHAKLGLDPDVAIKLHKEDRRTTHDCPGKDIEKAEFIQLVKEHMGNAGDHDTDVLPITPDLIPPKPPLRRGRVKVAANDWLNMRAASSASAAVLLKLDNGREIEILSEAKNGTTLWFRAVYAGRTGWVAARYVETL